MKYLIVKQATPTEPGLCVQPEKDKTDFEFCWSDYIASLPKLPTTCILPEGSWFEGEYDYQLYRQDFSGQHNHWRSCSLDLYATLPPLDRRKVIVPVEQKDEPVKTPLNYHKVLESTPAHIKEFVRERMDELDKENLDQKDEPKAGDSWLNYIKQFPKLDEFWNAIPEPAKCWLSQQIDIFAGQYPPKVETQPAPK